MIESVGWSRIESVGWSRIESVGWSRIERWNGVGLKGGME